MSRCVIFANGSLPDLKAAEGLLQAEDTIIAADGGTQHVLAMGRLPHVIVGDVDSLSKEARRRVEAVNTRLITYSHDKKETDLELAIHYAIESGGKPILLVGVLGRRLDHTLGNLALLSDPTFAEFDMRADDGHEQAFFCREQVEIYGSEGDIVSLIPWGQIVEGVRTVGLRWPLFGETLYPNKTRGISNELLGEKARVEVASGLLLIVHRRSLNER